MALKQSFHTIIEKSSAQIKFDLLSFHCYFTTIFQSNFSSTSQKMSTTARRRLMRDFKRLQEDPPEGVSGAPGLRGEAGMPGSAGYPGLAGLAGDRVLIVSCHETKVC